MAAIASTSSLCSLHASVSPEARVSAALPSSSCVSLRHVAVGLPSQLSCSGRRGLQRRQQQLQVSASALGPAGDGNVKAVESREDFEGFLQEAGGRLVVLDIATKTCGPCKFIYPKVVQLSLEYPDVVFLKIFGDLNDGTRGLMREWGIRAVPNFRFYRNGQLVHSHSGAKEDDLRANIKKLHAEEPVAV